MTITKSLNTISPGTFTSSILIGDAVTTSITSSMNASTDSIPSFTRVGGNTVSACLELQSTLGALLVPRMTTAQKNNLTAANGMILYDTTLGDFQLYNGGWIGMPSVVIPTVVNDVPVFTNVAGGMRDSGFRLIGSAVASTYLGIGAGNTAGLNAGNVGIGTNTLSSITAAINNTCLGDSSGLSITTSGANTLIGSQAGAQISSDFSGDANTGVGMQSLQHATFSSQTTALGFGAAGAQLNYTNCTLIGYQADTGVNNLTNANAIGYQATASVSNSMVLGGPGTKVGIGESSPDAALHITANPGVFGGVIFPMQNTNITPFILDETHFMVITAGHANHEFTLPLSTDITDGQVFLLINADPVAVALKSITLNTTGGEVINGIVGQTSLTINMTDINQGIMVTPFGVNGWLTFGA